MKQSKVLSVRLDLATLQSCFDFCKISNRPAKGASSAIARTLINLLKDLREGGQLPAYSQDHLEELLSSYRAIDNPTSMPSFERASLVEAAQSFDGLPPSLSNKPKGAQPLARPQSTIESSEILSREEALILQDAEKREIDFLLEEEIRGQQLLDEIDLLEKILIS